MEKLIHPDELEATLNAGVFDSNLAAKYILSMLLHIFDQLVSLSEPEDDGEGETE